MASEGPNFPGTISQTTTAYLDWSDIANLGADDGAVASVDLSTGLNISETLQVRDFGFEIPDGATIDGIEVFIDRRRIDNGGEAEETSLRLTKDGTTSSTGNKAIPVTLPTSLTVKSFGANDDLWGTTWTAAEINAATFGALYQVDDDNAFSDSAEANYISITVHYTEAAGGTTSIPAVSRAMLAGRKRGRR